MSLSLCADYTHRRFQGLKKIVGHPFLPRSYLQLKDVVRLNGKMRYPSVFWGNK